MTSPTTTTIAHALKGVDFPCSRDDLLAYARRNQAGSGAIELLSSVPERSYASMSDVVQALKRQTPPPEPADFYKEMGEPPPLAMPAPEPHRTEVMLTPWLWPWDFALRAWELAWIAGTWWWSPSNRR